MSSRRQEKQQPQQPGRRWAARRHVDLERDDDCRWLGRGELDWGHQGDAGLMNDRSMLIHSYNLASAPTQAAFVERMNSTIRQKLRLAVQAEQGTIQRSRATAQRQKVGWKPLLARAVSHIVERK